MPNKQKDASGCGRKFSFYGSVSTLPMLAKKLFQKLYVRELSFFHLVSFVHQKYNIHEVF